MDARSPRYRAVLFDFFGTLTEAVHRGPAHVEIARSLGCDPAAYLDALDATFYARASGAFGTPASGLRRVLDALGVAATEAQLSAALDARVDAVRADCRLREDAVIVLAALRYARLHTAVVSDCCYELPAFFAELPVAPLIDARIFSVHVGRCKPHPAMYLTACASIGVEPYECVYVGDGGSRELSGARDVGMTAIRLAAPDLGGHLVFHPDIDWTGPQVRSLTEIPALLDRTPSMIGWRPRSGVPSAA
jgi:putative hydrolase of the HAD superfamily